MIGTEVERLIVSLVGDGSSFRSMMNMAASQSASTSKSVERNASMIQSMTSKVTAYAASASSALGGLASKMGGMATMGLGAVGAGGAAGLMGLAGIGGAVAGAGWGIKLAADAEQAAISFEVMLGSADLAKRMLADLQKFANETPFEMPGLRDAAKMMMQFGVSQDRIMPNLKALGNVAGGDANKLNGLAYAFSQTQAAGRLMGQDLLQMINWGFNPLQEMARTTGKSMAQLKADMEKGQISAKMVEAAFISASSAGGKFDGMMEKQSKTLTGLSSTLADAIKMQVTKVGVMLIEKLDLKSVLSKLIVTAEKFGPIFVDKIGGALDWIIPKVKYVVSGIGSGLLSLYPIAQAVGSFFTSAFSEVWSVLQNVGKFIYPLIPSLEDVKNSVMQIYAAVAQWASENQGFLQTMGAVVASVIAFVAAKAALLPLIGATGAALVALLNPIGLMIAGLTTGVYLWTTYTESGKAAASEIGKAISFITEQFGMLVKLVQLGEIEIAWKITTTSINLAWAEAVLYIKSTWIGVKTFFAQAANLTTSVFLVMWEGIKIGGMVAANALIMAFNAIVPKKFEIPEFDVSGPMENILKLKKEYQATEKEIIEMQKAELAAASRPAEAARKAYDEAQKAGKKIIADDEKRKANPGGNWIGTAMTLGGMALDQLSQLAGPAMDAAGKAGNAAGGAYSSAMKAAMGSIDAVTAGSSKAYDTLTNYRDKMAMPVAQNPQVVAQEKSNDLLGQAVTGITSLVDLAKTAGNSVVQIVSSGLEE